MLQNQQKVILFTRVNNLTKKPDRVQLQLDLVQKVLNCRGDTYNKLYCADIFDPKCQNHQVQNSIIKNIHQKLLQNQNVFLFTFGVSGAGKTHSLFGSDFKQNEINQSSGILEGLFKKLKEESKQNTFQIGFSEIQFSSQNQVLVDLLQNNIINDLNQLNFQQFSTDDQLNKLFFQAAENSDSFTVKNKQIKFKNNDSHFIVQISITQQNQQKQFSNQRKTIFTLIDLLGFSTSQNEQQESLKSLIPIFNDQNDQCYGHLDNIFQSLLHSSQTYCLFTPNESKDHENTISIIQQLCQQQFKIQSYEINYKQQINKNTSENGYDEWNHFEKMSESYTEKESNTSVTEFWKKQQQDTEEQPSGFKIKQEMQSDLEQQLLNVKAQMANINDKLDYSYETDSQISMQSSRVHENNKLQKYTEKQKEINPEIDLKVTQAINAFNNYELNQDGGQEQYIILKKNFDILLGLYKESEERRKNIESDLQIARNDFQQIQTSTDIKIQDEKIKNLELQKKIRFMQQNKQQHEIYDYYETQIEKLQKEKKNLLSENNKIFEEIGNTLDQDQERGLIIKRNDKLSKKLQQKEEEIINLNKIIQKQEKNLNIQDQLNSKIVQLQKQLKEKQTQEKNLVQVVQEQEQQLQINKKHYYNLQNEYDVMKNQFSQLQEQLMLYKDLSDENIKLQRQKRFDDQQNKQVAHKDIKKKKEEIFYQLRSLMD